MIVRQHEFSVGSRGQRTMDNGYLGVQFGFTAWATHRTLDAVGTLTQEEFSRDLGTSFRSIRGTLIHMYGADWYWYRQLTGDEVPAPPWLFELGAGIGFAPVRGAYQELLERYQALAEQLTDPAVAVAFHNRPVAAHGDEIPAWQAAMNIVSHATYHRGQIAGLLRQMDKAPVETDLIRYLFQRDGRVWPYE